MGGGSLFSQLPTPNSQHGRDAPSPNETTKATGVTKLGAVYVEADLQVGLVSHARIAGDLKVALYELPFRRRYPQRQQTTLDLAAQALSRGRAELVHGCARVIGTRCRGTPGRLAVESKDPM